MYQSQSGSLKAFIKAVTTSGFLGVLNAGVINAAAASLCPNALSFRVLINTGTARESPINASAVAASWLARPYWFVSASNRAGTALGFPIFPSASAT